MDAEIQKSSRFLEDTAEADRCSGYGMCRIDFLDTGTCPVALQRRFAAFYPQGRMQVISAYRRGLVPLTPMLVEVALSCRKCGICDKQCYFVAGLRTSRIFDAFASHVASVRHSAVEPIRDPVIDEIAAIVGPKWCSSDPAITASYARARSPLCDEIRPQYVALPSSSHEVAELVKLCTRRGLPYLARGAATSLAGALTPGLVIDLGRMDAIRIDDARWCVWVGPGVSAFDLQKAASHHGMRANVAEPAASVCANVIHTNMHSFFSYGYGIGANHYIDAEFVSPAGEIYRLSGDGSPNPFFFRKGRQVRPLGICTGLQLRLHAIGPDESSALVPCGSIEEAISLARNIARRRIGVGLGVIGSLYLSIFAASSSQTVTQVADTLVRCLGIQAFVVVLGDRGSLASIGNFASPVLDAELASLMLRGLSMLHREPGFQLIMGEEGAQGDYREIFAPDMRPLLEISLRSSASIVDEDVHEDMRDFFTALRRNPERSDPLWLNSFRILPARMGRGEQFISRVLYYALEDPRSIIQACDRLGEVGERHGLRHGFGYLVPLEEGTRGLMEYDYYFDQTNPAHVEAMREAMKESAELVAQLSARPGFVCSGEWILMQGMSRPETYLFGCYEGNDSELCAGG